MSFTLILKVPLTEGVVVYDVRDRDRAEIDTQLDKRVAMGK